MCCASGPKSMIGVNIRSVRTLSCFQQQQSLFFNCCFPVPHSPFTSSCPISFPHFSLLILPRSPKFGQVLHLFIIFSSHKSSCSLGVPRKMNVGDNYCVSSADLCRPAVSEHVTPACSRRWLTEFLVVHSTIYESSRKPVSSI